MHTNILFKPQKYVYIDLLLENQVQDTVLVDTKFEAPGDEWYIERRGASYFLIENYMEGQLMPDVEETYHMGNWTYRIYWDDRHSENHFSISDMLSFSYWSYLSLFLFAAFLGIAWIQSLPYPKTDQIAIGAGLGEGEEKSSITFFFAKAVANLIKKKQQADPTSYDPTPHKVVELDDKYEEKEVSIGDGRHGNDENEDENEDEIWAKKGRGARKKPTFSEDANIDQDKVLIEDLPGLGELRDVNREPNIVYLKRAIQLHECRRYRIASYIEFDVQNKMEQIIRKIPRSKRKSLRIHFVVNTQKTITALGVYNIDERYKEQLEQNLQWIVNYQIPYPKACGYEIIMKLDFSDF